MSAVPKHHGSWQFIELHGYRFLPAPNRYRRMWPGMVPERIMAHARIRALMSVEFANVCHPIGLLLNVWDWQEYLVWSDEPVDTATLQTLDDHNIFFLHSDDRYLLRVGP